MNQQKTSNLKQAILLFAVISALLGAANSLGEANYANYFKEVYQVTAAQRGFIEFPRELPGVLCMFIISAFGMTSDVTIACLTQLLCCIGMIVMGFFAPSYGVMLFFVFLHSLGQHIFITLKDAIGMALAKEGEVGRTLGGFRRWWNLSATLASCTVFLGFRFGFFSFATPVIRPFVLSGLFTLAAVVLLFWLRRFAPQNPKKPGRRLVIKRRYLPYYLITLAFGCQKRIRLVFAPWVVVELLRRGADSVALLTIVASFAAMFVAPWLGKMLDLFGVRKALLLEGGYMIVIFTLFGALVGHADLTNGMFAGLSFLLIILSMLIEQFNIVHSFLVRRLAEDPAEITATLSTGLSLDHVVAITASAALGVIWTTFGAQYAFYVAAASAAVQLAVASTLRDTQPNAASSAK